MLTRSKYRNVPTEVEGIKFASKREALRYAELRLLEKAGQIHGLTLQRPFPIELAGQPICTYRADFTYMQDGKLVVEDSKGMRTPVYKLKAKLVRAVYGVVIQEV